VTSFVQPQDRTGQAEERRTGRGDDALAG